MNTRNQWTHGLQWGACAWLGYIIARTLPTAVKYGDPLQVSMAGAWFVSAALFLVGARWARGALGVAMLAQALYGTVTAIHFADTPDVPFVLRYFLPMSLPLLPLLWLGAERPRVVLAMIALGRWRDAGRELGGGRAWVTVLVAVGLVSINHATWDVLFDLDRGSVDPLSLLLPAVLFAIAAAATLAARNREQATA
jgi:hypothetical protein